jgi:hypothetical protein
LDRDEDADLTLKMPALNRSNKLTERRKIYAIVILETLVSFGFSGRLTT